MSDVGTLPANLATARLMASARQATARLPRLAWQNPEGLAAAVAAVRSAVAELWPQVPPEAARDALLKAASTACLNGLIAAPTVAGMSAGELAAVGRMLELADEWLIAGYYHAALGQPRLNPDQAAELNVFASSLAFNPDHDQETRTTLSVLLALAVLATPLPTRRGGLWLE